MVSCCVLNCRSRSIRDNLGFHRIPRESHYPHRTDLNELSRLRRRKWLEAINRPNMTEKAINNSAVCSKHFITGKSAALTNIADVDWIPTLEMGHKTPDSQHHHHQYGQKSRSQQGILEDANSAPIMKNNTVCRICLIEITNPIYELTTLFEDVSEQKCKKVPLIQALQTITSMTIPLRPDYPQYICATCTGTLKLAYRFIAQCKESQKKLERKLKKTYNIDAKNIDGVSMGRIDNRLKRSEVEFIIDEEDTSLADATSIEIDKQRQRDEGFSDETGLQKKMESVSVLENDVITVWVKDDIEAESGEHDVATCSDMVEHNASENALTQPFPSQELQLDEDTNHILILSASHDHIYDDKKPINYDCSEENQNKMSDVLIIEQTNEETTCNVCGLEFPTELEMFSHRQQIHENKFNCEYCMAHFTSNRALLCHMKKKHTERFSCEICGLEFYTQRRLISHRTAHVDKRKYKCSICGRRFFDQNSVESHMSKHWNKCTYCAKMFKTPTNLKIHERIHTGEKPYLCRFCPERYCSSGHLRVHENVHVGFMPFQCKFCEKGFRQIPKLKVHLLQHSGPHKCDYCRKSFIEKPLLLFHYKRSHADLVPEVDLSDWNISDYYVRPNKKI